MWMDKCFHVCTALVILTCMAARACVRVCMCACVCVRAREGTVLCKCERFTSFSLLSFLSDRDASYSPQVSVGTTYGRSTLPAHIGYISCSGDEDSIFDCSINYNGQSCGRYYDIGVDCLPRFTLN